MMNTNVTFRQQADIGMPMFTQLAQSGRARVASACALPMTPGTTGTTGITHVAVLKGTYPGTSAWRPPN